MQELIENKPCVSPHEMTEDQLINELIERGKDASGSREEMLARLLELEQSMYMDCDLRVLKNYCVLIVFI